ncbi:MAG: hypothetical protein GC189_08050 [Alphaproteobacteria bacterium]|nr:hypothetical protein [Alphaproteobacteria bacterium]
MRNCVALLLAALALAFACPAHATDGEWRRAETEHFVLYSNQSERRLREAAQQLEAFDWLLRTVMGVTDAETYPKLDVYLLGSRESLRILWPDVDRNVAGFYAASPEAIQAFAVASERYGLDGPQILFHEYAHHFMHQHFANAYPAWFVEGFAEYMATADITLDRVQWGEYSVGRALTLVEGRWLPIDRLLRNQGIESTDDRQRFYAQSWLLTHFFYSSPENTQLFLRYLQRLRDGADAVAALSEVTGQTPEAFEQTLRAYSRARIGYQRLRTPDRAAASIVVTRLSSAADDVLLPHARMRWRVKANDRAAFLEQIRSLSAPHMSDPIARRAMARAEIQYGSRPAGRELLAPLIASGSTDVEALYLMGLSYVLDAEDAENDTAIYAQSRPYFARAFRADPLNAPTLYRYGLSFAWDPGPMPPARLDVLVQAYNFFPQVDEIAAATAFELGEAGRVDDAVAVLTPLLQDPHRPEAARQAREMLAQIRRMHGGADEDAPQKEAEGN